MNHHPTVRSLHHRTKITWVLLLLLPVIGMAVDLIAPSLPSISAKLHVSQSIAKNAITTYLIGYAIGNFITGFLADNYGRKQLLRISLLGFFIVSLLPAIYANEFSLLLSRTLQGFFLGAQAALCRTIFSDIFSPKELQSIGTLIGTMWGIGPVLGPVLGSYLQHYFGWESGFIFFAVTGLILLIFIVFIVPETLIESKPLKLSVLRDSIKEIISHRTFMGLSVLMGVAYALLIIFNTQAPFLIQKQLNYSVTFYGYIAFFLGVVFISATFLTRKLLKTWSGEKLFFYGIHTLMLLLLIATLLSIPYANNMILITLSSAVAFFATGFLFPSAMGQGMALFRHMAGAATSVMYLINISITAAVSLMMSFFHLQDSMSLVLCFFVLQIIAVFIFWLTIYRKLKVN